MKSCFRTCSSWPLARHGNSDTGRVLDSVNLLHAGAGRCVVDALCQAWHGRRAAAPARMPPAWQRTLFHLPAPTLRGSAATSPLHALVRCIFAVRLKTSIIVRNQKPEEDTWADCDSLSRSHVRRVDNVSPADVAACSPISETAHVQRAKGRLAAVDAAIVNEAEGQRQEYHDE